MEFDWIAPERAGPADELHGRPLFGRLVDGCRADARGGRGRGPSPVHRARHDGRHQERHAAGRHRLHAAEQVGQRDPARLERPLRLAEVHDGHPARVLRRRARGAGRDGPPVLPADPRHEPDLHRQGRLVHRHQADAAGRREHAPRGREVRHDRGPDGRPVPDRADRQGLATAPVRCPP